MSTIGKLVVNVEANIAHYAARMAEVVNIAAGAESKLAQIGRAASDTMTAGMAQGAKVSAASLQNISQAADFLSKRLKEMQWSVFGVSNALARANLVNFAFLRSVEQWKGIAAVAASGAGRLANVFDAMNKFVTGAIAPLRALHYVMTTLVVPALQALATALLQVANSPAANKLGANLQKLSTDLAKVGAGYRLPVMQQIFAGFGTFGRISLTTAGAVGKLGMSLARLIPGLSRTKPAADQAAKSLANLGSQAKTAGSGGITPMRAGLLELAPTLAAFGAAAAGVIGVIRGFKAAFDMSNQMEKTEVTFAVLTGSFEKAEERMKSLSTFASQTPFEFEQIANASRLLEKMGGSALATEATLRMVGDMAAAAGTDLDGLANWVGRAYSAIQAGQPFGAAAQRLQELGLLSGKARLKLEEMQKSGASGAEIWAEFEKNMGRFSGTMALQSQTTSGILTTLKDTAMLSMVDIVDAIKDAFSFREAAQSVLAYATWFRAAVIPAITETLKGVGEYVRSWADMIAFGFEFVGNHWIDVFKLAATSAALQIVRLGNIIVHTFTEVIPGYLSWFAGNWRDIFTTIYDFTATVFSNLYSNVTSVMQSIWDWLASGGMGSLEFAWTPLTEGFKSSIRELPQIAEREIGGLEKTLETNLEAIAERVGGGWQREWTQREKELEQIRDNAEKMSLPQAAEAGGDFVSHQNEKQRPGGVAAVTRGSSDAESAIEAARRSQRGDADVNKKVAKNTELTVKELRELVRTFRNAPGNKVVTIA